MQEVRKRLRRRVFHGVHTGRLDALERLGKVALLPFVASRRRTGVHQESPSQTLRSSACTLVANSLLDANDGAPLVRGVWPQRCGYAIFSTNSRPQAWAYFLSVASDGECLPVASERSNRAMEGG